jgi:type II secretory pathway component GspD/PulD (secretin)
VTVAELLKRVFRRGAFDFGDSMSPTIEADERLNAIVVYAGRNDRAVIEQLLEALDTDQVPDSLATNRPMRVPVKYTDAAGIENVLRDLYQTQLSSGARVKPIPVPSGASRDVAAVIQQINTAAGGPLMTLGVDEATNSIVVMAPRPLAEEVAQLVGELDEAALHDSSRAVKVVKLNSVGAEQVKEVLDDLIRGAAQRQSGRRRGGR